MKVRYFTNKLEFELEGSTEKELFKQIAKVSEVFEAEPCGACKSEETRFCVRTVEENDYFERQCTKCGAKLSYGQNKKGGALFPKRKDADGKWDSKCRGWAKYVPATNPPGDKPGKGKV